MASVCLYFHVHQPLRLRRYTIFDSDPDYFDNSQNRDILLKVTHKCYLPANQVLLDLIRRYEGRFKVSFSVTGAIIEQFRCWAPEVLDSFPRDGAGMVAQVAQECGLPGGALCLLVGQAGQFVGR